MKILDAIPPTQAYSQASCEFLTYPTQCIIIPLTPPPIPETPQYFPSLALTLNENVKALSQSHSQGLPPRNSESTLKERFWKALSKAYSGSCGMDKTSERSVTAENHVRDT